MTDGVENFELGAERAAGSSQSFSYYRLAAVGAHGDQTTPGSGIVDTSGFDRPAALVSDGTALTGFASGFLERATIDGAEVSQTLARMTSPRLHAGA